MNLEMQVKEARITITMHQCPDLNATNPNENIRNCGNATDGAFQTIKIATLENKTNTLENKTSTLETNLILLTSKLENLQFNFLASGKVSTDTARGTPKTEKILVCYLCNYEANEESLMQKHKES